MLYFVIFLALPFANDQDSRLLVGEERRRKRDGKKDSERVSECLLFGFQSINF